MFLMHEHKSQYFQERTGDTQMESFPAEILSLTLRSVLRNDGYSCPGVLQGSSGLLVCGVVEVDAIHLKQQRRESIKTTQSTQDELVNIKLCCLLLTLAPTQSSHNAPG